MTVTRPNIMIPVNKWAGKGFRMLSLIIYDTPQDPQYAAVMVKRPVVIEPK